MNYFCVNKYVNCFHNMPEKRILVTYKVCFVSEKAGLLENSYNSTTHWEISVTAKTFPNINKLCYTHRILRLRQVVYLLRSIKNWTFFNCLHEWKNIRIAFENLNFYVIWNSRPFLRCYVVGKKKGVIFKSRKKIVFLNVILIYLFPLDWSSQNI